LLVGYAGPPDAAPYFNRCTEPATIDNGSGLGNDEQVLPLMLCQPTTSWTTLWPHLIHYN
jgi:hypothetical protein